MPRPIIKARCMLIITFMGLDRQREYIETDVYSCMYTSRGISASVNRRSLGNKVAASLLSTLPSATTMRGINASASAAAMAFVKNYSFVLINYIFTWLIIIFHASYDESPSRDSRRSIGVLMLVPIVVPIAVKVT